MMNGELYRRAKNYTDDWVFFLWTDHVCLFLFFCETEKENIWDITTMIFLITEDAQVHNIAVQYCWPDQDRECTIYVQFVYVGFGL